MNDYLTETSWIGVLPWWYNDVPREIIRHQVLLIETVADYFSFSILFKTLFEPWKRDELSTERLSLQERIQVLGLNLVSRFFGFLMRSAAIVVGAITMVALFGFLAFLWMAWVLAPFLGVALLGLGFVTMLGGFR